MELQRGTIVRSAAGRDKGSFCAILRMEGDFALLCDGRRRPLERPKHKKRIHLAPTGTVLPEQALRSNRAVRQALRTYRAGQCDTHEEAES